MKVRFVTTWPPENCGIATYSKSYVEALRRCCDVDVAPITRPQWNPLYFVKLALRARKGADVIHVQYDAGFFGTIGKGRLSLSGMYTPLFYLLIRVFGGPAVVTTVHEVQDARKNYGGRWLYWPLHLYYMVVYGFMALLSDAVLVHTQGTIGMIAQYISLKNAEIMPLAVIVEPVFLAKEECKARLGLAGKKVVGMFGYVSPPKGHDLAIEAVRVLPDDVVLYVAGDGRTAEDEAYVRALKEKVETYGLERKVRFHGFVKDEDMPLVMGATDVVLMPYRHVVQSSALTIALAYLKPVLATNIGGFAEVAREYGCIETYLPGSSEAMQTALSALLRNSSRREELIERAGRYSATMEMGKIATKTCETYENALEKRDKKGEQNDR